MGREYSSRRTPRKRSSAPHQFLVITATFLLGYLSATVFDIDTISRWINTQVLAQDKSQDKPKATKHAAIPPKPKFEFYTLLTNDKVPNSQPATNTTKSSTVAPTHNTATPQTAAVNAGVTTAGAAVKSNEVQKPAVITAANARSAAVVSSGRGAYSVQVASFKARQDAEHMKGSLILKGFNVTVVPITHTSRGNWFRVVVGPYANRVLAQRAQVELARHEHLHGMVTAG